MSQEHLKNIAEREDFLELTSKGGSVKSEAKSRAAKIRGIKMMKQENIEKKALQLANDPKTTALEIMRMIVLLKEKEELKPETEIQLIRVLNDSYRTVFGNNINIQADINQQIAIKTEIAQVEAKKEYLLRTKLLEFISNDLESHYGYEQSINIMRIIYEAIRKIEAEPLQQIQMKKAIIITKIRKFLPQVNYDFQKAIGMARQEMEQEQKEVIKNE